MALANSSLQSHITPDSTASLFRTKKEIRKESRQKVDQEFPRLVQKYQNALIDSRFAPLPHELELLIMSVCSKDGSSDALLNLGLTSKYWHLRVRDFVEKDPDGQAFRQAHEYRQFVARNGRTPSEQAKNAIRQSRGLEGMMFEATPENTIAKLRSSFAPVTIKVQPSSKWSTGFGKALSARKGCVTILDILPGANPGKFILPAINATPAGAYLALLLPPERMPAEHALSLAEAIEKNPVVCYVANLVEDYIPMYLPRDPDLSLLAACAENDIEGIPFRLEYENLRKERALVLVDVLKKFKSTVSLEIFSLKTSQEAMDVIIEAVRSINQASPGKVTITCDGSEIGNAVGKAKFKALAQDGIYFVNARAWQDDSSDSDPISDDDSDTIVRSTSSEEDSYGEYESDVEQY